MTDWSVIYFDGEDTMSNAPATAPASRPRAPKRKVRARAEKSAARREAIIAAALDEFSARGFAATRIDDVARRAGVAKGTIYLYFRDKESLFQELVRTLLSPLVGTLVDGHLADVPVQAVGEAVAELFVREIFGTRRKDVIRLIITEGPRFPKIAKFYYHEVIERALSAMRGGLGLV